MSNEATPRINAQYLENFTNQMVRICGKIVALRGETAVLDAAGNINIHLNRDAHLTLNNAAEIVGKVQPDLSVKVFQATDFGNNIGGWAFFSLERKAIVGGRRE
ncbi:hypothetical protein MMC20_006982 [Loxospora ochrophaea]|nr:hypothetical protein [Loxospora ochrophaea]